ncbi:MAG: zinc-dependent alcohol dehydrogenase family protein [Jatrophihabitans sp.]
MRAVRYDAFGAPPVVRDVADPTPAPDGVVIDVAATGVCRSDWHGWVGHDPDIVLPNVPGHEFAGVVSRVGADVHAWSVGDRVTVPFVCACGRCEPCLAGEHQVCRDQFQPGFTAWGSFAERVALPRADLNLVRLPDALDFVTAAALGCRFSTAYRAVRSHGAVRPGEWVAVHGCGGVGIATVMIAAAHGARVVAVDVSRAALRLATSAGAELTLLGSADMGAAVRDVTDGGAHVSLDAFGSAGTCAASIESLRPRGRHVQIGLLPSDDGRTALPMGRVIADELQVFGSHGMAAHAFPEILAEIGSGLLDPALLVGRTISLDEAPAALMAMSEPAAAPGTSVIQMMKAPA